MTVAARHQAEDPLQGFCAGVAEDLMSLAVLHSSEFDAPLVRALRQAGFPEGLKLGLQSKRGTEALQVMAGGLADIPAVVDAHALDVLAADYADIYLNHTLGASPCESVWLDEDGLAMQQPMFQIRACYRRHGLAAQDWRKRSDDHLVHQLQFLSYLLDPAEEEGEDPGEAARFMDEHLLRWIDDFSSRVAGRCATAFYAGLAVLTAAYVDELREILARVLEEPRPAPEDIAARMRPNRSVQVEMPAAYVPGAEPSW